MTIWVPAGREEREAAPIHTAPANDPRFAELRAPFPASQIGKLPRVWCYNCTQANKNRRGSTCDEHQSRPCPVCRNKITTAHLHLDYIGHAAVTSRLLSVDPMWKWVPIYEPEKFGYPKASSNGLWIELTVLGVTRPGYGDTGNTQLGEDDAIKARISDAIKNAAMRFGVGLDIWSKEDLIANEEAAAAARDEVQRGLADGDDKPHEGSGRDWMAEVKACQSSEELTKLASEANDLGEFVGKVKATFVGRRRQLENKKGGSTTATASNQPEETKTE